MKQILRSLLGKKKPGRSNEPRTPVYQPVQREAGSTSAPQAPNKKDSAPQKSANTESTTGAQSTEPKGKPEDRTAKDGESKNQAKQAPARKPTPTKPAQASESKPAAAKPKDAKPAAKPAAKDTTRPSTEKSQAHKATSAKPQQPKSTSPSPAAKVPKAKPAAQKSAAKPSATQETKAESSPKAAVKKQQDSPAQDKKPQRKAHEPVQRPRRGASFSTTPSKNSPRTPSARSTSPKPAAKPVTQPSQKGAVKLAQQARPRAEKPKQAPKPSSSSSAKKASPHPAKPQKSQPANSKPATDQQQAQKPRSPKQIPANSAKEQPQPQPAPKKDAQPSKPSQPTKGQGPARTPGTAKQKAAPPASAPNAPAPKKGTATPKSKVAAPKTASDLSQQKAGAAQNQTAHKGNKVVRPKSQQGAPSKGNLPTQQAKKQQPQPEAKETTPQDNAKKVSKRRPQVKPSDISRGLARKSQQVGTLTPAQQKPSRAAQKPKAKQQPDSPQPKKAEPQAAPKMAPAKADKSAATGAAAAGVGTAAAAAAEKKREKAQPSKEEHPAPEKPQAKAAPRQPQQAAQKPASQQASATQVDTKSKYPLQKQAKDPEALATPPESKVVKKKRHARLRQVKGLDGLRGLAVIAVVLYHFFPSLLPGGYLGVDLFFVLSGFLITSLLVREFRTSGTISLKDFWVRRFRRILPAAVSVLVMCTALVAWIGGDLAVGLRQQFLGTLFFVNNWTQIATSQSYFADNEIQVFAHYWSLAVEEQFYVIWPLLITGVFLISRRKPRRLPIFIATVLAIGSAVAMALIYVPGEDPTRVYYGTDTHAFGLLTGAVLSLLMTSTKSDPQADSWAAAGKAESRIAGIIGTLALIGYGAQLFLMPDDAEITYRGGLFLTSVLGVLMVWGVVREYGPMTPLFRTKVMRWFGQRSFSLYLWHWPVIMMLKALFEGNQNSDKSWILGLVAVPISLLLSEISYQFIENPFRRGGYKKTWKTYWSSRPGFSELRDGFGKTMWPVVPFLVIASVAGVVYGVVNSSDKTELEQQLEQLQQQNQSSNNAPVQPNDAASQPPAEDNDDKAATKDMKTRPMPQGKDITAVGDSVMLASSGALKQRFPQIYVDADVSRHYTAGIQVLQQLKDSGQLRDTVFLGFGTNGPAFPDQIKEALDIIGKDRTIVMAVPYGDREWMSQSQQDVIDAAKEYDNVYIADWCGHAQSNPEILYSDGVHPMPERTGEYSDAFYDALKQYSTGEKTVSSQCVPQ
ncbi:acyltransferase family protein [uncultured Corynebacterium sp.]|uniref:acyltransferase family protein n=1 Tax=uncultured Corynebacterium sp. TaxID=159447 RepID=UPI00262EF77D|nr:acyltransferase family protein [uncultured Corynebacterium sp.]